MPKHAARPWPKTNRRMTYACISIRTATRSVCTSDQDRLRRPRTTSHLPSVVLRPSLSPADLKTAIWTTDSATKVQGDEADSARITVAVCPEDLGQIKELFKFRGVE